MKKFLGGLAHLIGAFGLIAAVPGTTAQDAVLNLAITNGSKQVFFPLLPGIDEFKLLRTTNLSSPFAPATSGTVSGYTWSEPGQGGIEFYKLELKPTDPGAVLAATVLNRLAYGPTPDELVRVKEMGVDAYIREQLAPEKIQENLEQDIAIPPGTEWQQVTVTGRATSSTLYIFVTVAGDCYVDDLKLVRGSVADSGANTIINGDFEAGLAGWTLSPIFTNSIVTTETKHGGSASLHVISSAAGSTRETSIWRADLGLTTDQTYTLSYWYKLGGNRNSGLVVRLSGADPGNGTIYSTPPAPNAVSKLAYNYGVLNDLAAWHVLHAVQSKKQLLETMLQFLENHFVTQQSKSRDYFDRYYDGSEVDIQATNLEYRELERWRQAFLNPQCTFYDLLKISAESPAMIIYLDTVGSKGNGGNVANENYARELLELFTFGVDNGYDQNDITVMSRAWTGWSIRLVDATNEFNPLAPQSTTLRPSGTNANVINNLEGLWAFAYKPENHNNSEKTIFPAKIVPDRFGPPYAGRNYELKLTSPSRSGTEWVYVTKTGRATGNPADIYLTLDNGIGDCYIDDLKLVVGTLPEVGQNLIVGGEFDTSLAGWTLTPAVSTSAISTDVKHAGAGSLHLICTEAGTGVRARSIRRGTGADTNLVYTLSYWYRPGASMSSDLLIRLSGADENPSANIYSTPGSPTDGMQDGYKAIAHLADQPFTQEFISVKLCRLFVHDDFAIGYDFTDPNLSPEGRLVRECMRAWENGTPKGQIRKVLETIFNSELFRTQAANAQKVKTPFEFTVSAVRALRGRAADGTYTADTDGYAIRSPMNRMGRMRLFDREEPDGYPEAGAPWISGGTLAERLRFVQSLLIASGSGKSDAGTANVTDPVKLLKDRLPQNAWNDAGAVSDFFLGLIYPGEGKANLGQYRSYAIGYLNTADDGTTASEFATLTNATNYDNRVRGMVAALMTFPRFQEQ